MTNSSVGGYPEVELEDVSLTYEGSPPVHALRHVSLAVLSGEFVSVVGPSGSGKSTFLNVVGLLDRPTEGTYRLGGLDTRDLSEGQRTAFRGRRVGFVFQAFHLLSHRTAEENVALAMLYSGIGRAERNERAREALHRVGLGQRINSMPSTMSGGERQRVAIARAVVSRPGLLLCDEPTGNLDSETAATVLELLGEINEAGQTVIVITHDLRVAKQAQRRLSITDGTLTEHAQPAGATPAPPYVSSRTLP